MALNDEAQKRIEAAKAALSKASQKTNETLLKNEKKREARLKAKGKEPKPYLGLLANTWSDEFKKAFPDVQQGKWSGKEWGQADLLVKKFDVESIRNAIRYVIRSFETINKRIFKGSAMFPTLGMLLKLDNTLVPEAQRWHQLFELKREVDEWTLANPHTLLLPDHLREKYEAASKEMENLGLLR